MHKLIFAAAAPLAAMLLSNTVHAATNSDLSVTAKVLPSACTLSLGNEGVFNYGDMTPEILDADNSMTDMPPKTNSYSITCPTAMYIGFKTVDGREGTDVGGMDFTYGMGTDADGTKIGYYSIFSDSGPVINNSVGDYVVSSNNGADWSFRGERVDLRHNPSYIASFVLGGRPGSATPTPVSSVTSNLWVVSYIVPKALLDLTRVVNLNGSATLELFYI